MATKNGGKQFLGKLASRLCTYPMDQKFLRNRSISHCFRDKCVFAFYAEVQDGRHKWRENDFWKKLPLHSLDTVRVKNLSNSPYLAPFLRY